jgi:hypothetical protein
MTDEEALKEYETALQDMLSHRSAPQRDEDPNRWVRVLDRETRAWRELHSRRLLDSFPYFDTITNAHRHANALRSEKYRL